MRSFLDYHLYYFRFHKKEVIVTLVNLGFLTAAIISGISSLQAESGNGRARIAFLSAVGFLINVGWSVYDDLLKDRIEAKRNKLFCENSLAQMYAAIEKNRISSENGEAHWKECAITDEQGREAGHAFYQPAVNAMLCRARSLPAVRSKDAEARVVMFIEQHKDILFHFLADQYREARAKDYDFFSERKLCLSDDMRGDLDQSETAVHFHSGYYYDTFLTNICSTKQLMGRTSVEVFYDGQEHYPLRDGTLAPLKLSCLNNEIGVSTLAVTADRYLVIWQQNMNASPVSAGKLAPSGSGSADWDDMQSAPDKVFPAVIIRGMERELREESRLKKAEIRGTRVIGYFRWMEKGAKPEFTGVTSLCCGVGDIRPDTSEIANNSIPHHERIEAPTAGALLKVLDRVLGKEKLSLPLKMNLIFLRQYICTEDLGGTEDAPVTEAQDERISFIFGIR